MTNTTIICVKCGKTNAKRGSMIYPVCNKCYKKYYDSNYLKYLSKIKREN